jgi:Terminase small subunit
MTTGLKSSQQEKFAQAIASGLSQSGAYRKAYPASLKWKDDSVHNKASALMRDARVAARVQELTHKAADIAVLEGAAIIREIARVSFSDIAGIMHPDGRVKMPHELEPATRAAVASFEINQYGEIKYKFWDKNSALEKAAKIRGLFKEDNKQVADNLADLLGSLGGKVAVAVPIAPAATDDGDND